MLDQTAFVNQATREYQIDPDFRRYVSEMLLRLRAHEPGLPPDALSCFPLLMGTGEALGKVLLEGYQRRCGDQQRPQLPTMGSSRRKRYGGL